jgi:hypothetical protein
MNKKQVTYSVIIMVLGAALIRLFPYLFDMGEMTIFVQPIFAMGLFGVSVFRKNWYALLLPMAGLLLGDLLIQAIKPGTGFYEGFATNYACIVGSMLLGYFIKPTSSTQVALGSLLVPTAFYLVSNYLLWQNSGMYAHTGAGLLTCYEMGFIFYLKDIVSTALFSSLLFGVYHFVLQKNMAKQTIR